MATKYKFLILVIVLLPILACSRTDGNRETMSNQRETVGMTFWDIVDAVRNTSPNPESRPAILEQHLVRLAATEIQYFDKVYHEQLTKSYRWDLWGAAYIIGGGCSDDGFRYFRDYLISEGREVFERSLSDPDSLAALKIDGEAELESFGYAASKAYEKLTGSELPYPEIPGPRDPVGQEWEEDDLGSLFPRLAKKYGWDT